MEVPAITPIIVVSVEPNIVFNTISSGGVGFEL